jgi:hypothetical protein
VEEYGKLDIDYISGVFNLIDKKDLVGSQNKIEAEMFEQNFAMKFERLLHFSIHDEIMYPIYKEFIVCVKKRMDGLYHKKEKEYVSKIKMEDLVCIAFNALTTTLRISKLIKNVSLNSLYYQIKRLINDYNRMKPTNDLDITMSALLIGALDEASLIKISLTAKEDV